MSFTHDPVINIKHQHLLPVDIIAILASYLDYRLANIDSEVSNRISKASPVFGRIQGVEGGKFRHKAESLPDHSAYLTVVRQ
uniref:Uncharacterized protein n=1 Tax=Arion vulgaris TaxID=1028688 RepID=A0A0B7AUI2_9EUPU